MPDTSEHVIMARCADNLLSAIRKLRRKKNLNLEGSLVFLAVGTLNFREASGSMSWVNPASISDVADILHLPRETTRRRLLDLEKSGLVKRTSYGFLVNDLKSWSQLMSLADAERSDL